MESSGSTIATVIATLVAVLSLLFTLFVEREKASKLYSEVRTRLRSSSGRFSDLPATIVRAVRIVFSVLFAALISYFIVFVPIFLYGQFHQPSNAVSSTTNNTSTFYLLIVVLWCISIVAIYQMLTINKLRDEVDYLNRLPGIKQLKDEYNKQLFESAMQQWDDFQAELVSNHDNSPFAIDIASCSLLDVQDETLIICCPNRVIYKRMHPNPSSQNIDDSEYQEKIRDKESIETFIKKRFKVIGISYTLKKQITT